MRENCDIFTDSNALSRCQLVYPPDHYLRGGISLTVIPNNSISDIC